MSSNTRRLKRAAAFLLAFVMVFTTVFTADALPVNAASSKVVTKIKVAKKSVTLNKSKSTSVKVTVSVKNGASKKFTVKSNKTSVATAKVSGSKVKITAKKKGNATITVTTKAKNAKGKKLSAKIKVTVNEADTKATTTQQPSTQPTTPTQPTQPTTPTQPTEIPVTDVTVTVAKSTIEIGSPTVVTASVVPANATNKSITFSSVNPSIATVDAATGAVLGIAEGTVEIKATAANGVSKSVIVRVVPIAVESITLNQTEAEITIPNSLQLTATVLPANATNPAVKWNSEEQQFATVDQTGKVTPVAEGTTTITATTEDGNFIARCTVKVTTQRLVAEGPIVEVTNSATIAGKKYDNTQLVGRDMTFLVTVGNKAGQPVSGDNITVTLDYGAGNMTDYYTVKETSIKTDESGRAQFTVGLKTEYAKMTAVQGKFQSIKVNVSESDSNNVVSTSVKFASVKVSDITVLQDEKYFTLLETGKNADAKDNGLYTTKSQDGARSQTYVNNQRVSTTGHDHKVYLTAAPYLLIPATVSDVERDDWTYEVPGEKQGGSCSVYNDQNNTQTTVEVAKIPSGLKYLTLYFNTFELSKYTTLTIDVYDKYGENYYHDTKTTAHNGTKTIQVEKLKKDVESYLVVSLLSEGQVDTTSAGYALTKITGPYATVNPEDGELIELDGTVSWADVSNAAIGTPEITTLTYEQASKYIPEGSQFLNEDYSYKYQVPAFPYSGNAILIVTDSNGEEKASFSFPSENGAEGNTYSNKNVIVNPATTDKKAILLTDSEKNNVTGSLTQDGNVAILDATKDGMQFVKATIKVDGLNSTELNKQNGAELYSFVHWAPVPKTDAKVENPDYFAIEGQQIKVTAQLLDGNGNAQGTEGELITFKYGENGEQTIALTGNNKNVGDHASFVSVTNNGATDQNGKVTVTFRDITNNEEFSSIEGLTAESAHFDVKLSISLDNDQTTEAVEGPIDLYWVDLGLTFVDSAVAADNPVRTTNFIDEELAITKAAEYTVSEKNKWRVGYLPVARSQKFQYSNPELVDRTGIEKKHQFASVSGVSIVYEKSGEMTCVQEGESAALVSSTVAGDAKLTGTIEIKDPAKVVFVFYDDDGNRVEAKNIGSSTGYSTTKTSMTLQTSWKPNGIVAEIFAPRHVCENTAANAYVRVTDSLANPLEGKEVTYTITGVNATTKAEKAVETVKGVYQIALPKPDDISLNDCTIVVYVTGKEYGTKTITYDKDPNSAFAIAEPDSFKVSEDGKTVEVFFTNAIDADSVKPNMFKLVKTADGSEIYVDAASKKDRNSVILTLRNAISDLSLEHKLVISESDDKGVITWLGDTNGQFIKEAEKAFKPADYVK